jgi:hypothetical protein
MKEEVKKELIEYSSQSYDKGFNDALDGIKEAFGYVKKAGINMLPMETIIKMIDEAKKAGEELSSLEGL